MQRQRIEDLGILTEKLSKLHDDEIFAKYETLGVRRKKDFMQAFAELSDEAKLSFADDLVYGIDRVHDEIAECWGVARGEEQQQP